MHEINLVLHVLPTPVSDSCVMPPAGAILKPSVEVNVTVPAVFCQLE